MRVDMNHAHLGSAHHTLLALSRQNDLPDRGVASNGVYGRIKDQVIAHRDKP